MPKWGDWDPRSDTEPPGGWAEYRDDPSFQQHLADRDSAHFDEDHLNDPPQSKASVTAAVASATTSPRRRVSKLDRSASREERNSEALAYVEGALEELTVKVEVIMQMLDVALTREVDVCNERDQLRVLLNDMLRGRDKEEEK